MKLIARGSEGKVWRLGDRPQVVKEVTDPNLRHLLSPPELSRRYRQWLFLRTKGFAAPLAIRRRRERLWLITPYIEGDRFSNISSGQGLSYLVGAALALEKLHRLGFLHGDIAPQNLIVNPRAQSTTWIDWINCDLRSAKFYRGTAPFMAPEFLACGRYDVLSEIFALGAFGVSVQQSYPRVLADVFAKAMHPLPTRRWSSAQEFAIALDFALLRSGGEIAAEAWIHRNSSKLVTKR